MSTIPELIPVHVAGQELRLHPVEVKGKPGRYWFTFHKRSKTGRTFPSSTVTGPALAAKLPDEFVIDGERVATKVGATQNGNPKVAASTVVERDGVEYRVTFQVSSPPSGNWALTGKAIRKPEGNAGFGALKDFAELL